ncbi:hypothetical protein EJR11_22495 [Salmonella enterica]|nr:hypothetical protein [Salmonella enterica]EBS0087853.1 hypothetical protein [Salmonella enterica subsp. enterica serovar Muenster]EAS3262050.1 hypothetical protein [Salmonella enterica]EAS9367797.1 hypothetical protein [Salmonella enterica]EBK3635606.1 hypothetical protein [Salmonella enterica]
MAAITVAVRGIQVTQVVVGALEVQATAGEMGMVAALVLGTLLVHLLVVLLVVLSVENLVDQEELLSVPESVPT